MYSKRVPIKPVNAMYNLDHLLNGHFDSSKVAFSSSHQEEEDDDHITDFWIEDKFRGVGFGEDCDDDIEIETPLDLSLRKVVR